MLQLPGPIAVIDVETTGLFPWRHDRIVEIAAVVVNEHGMIEREFVSLVNPQRDVGPTRIHGLTAEDVLHAPPFCDIAPLLIDALQGTIALAAHNATFDPQFLQFEFSRLGVPLPDSFLLCTMQLGGGRSLNYCCSEHGIPMDGDAHTALADARAAARLLTTLLSNRPSLTQRLAETRPIRWPAMAITTTRPLTRTDSRRRQAESPTYLARLLQHVRDVPSRTSCDGAVMAYTALLDGVIEDRQVDDAEGDLLLEAATRWGLGASEVRSIHYDYVGQLARAALADGVVTNSERRDLELVARLLLGPGEALGNMLTDGFPDGDGCAKSPDGGGSLLTGKRVCFTGEPLCTYEGRTISRHDAEKFATLAGLEVASSVTKKLDLLVVADPQTQSGKAKKARQYGVRIMYEPVFWKAIGLEVG
jgi:DNA polymerase III subunit epsilon